MKKGLRILFAEDVAIHHLMAKQILLQEGIKFEPFLVEAKDTFLDALHNFKPDIVITDFMMPDFDGMEALKLTLDYNPLIPVIILTGSINEEVAVDCLRNGATNYVIKENLMRLPFAVKEAIEKKRALAEKTSALIALQESESRLSSITNAAGDAIIMMDNDGLVSFWNPAAEKIFGFAEQESIGKDLHALIVPENHQIEFRNKFPIFQQTGEGNAVGKSLEMKALKKNGDLLNVSITLSAVKVKEKWHAVGIVRDITDRKHSEEELIAAKQRAEASDRLKTAFINNISHEVRTPLNGILGFSALIMQPDLPDEDKEQFFSIIKISSSRLLNTMASYMDISMIVSGNMEVQVKPFDLNHLLYTLRDQFQPMCTVKNLDFYLTIPEDYEICMLNSDTEVIRKAVTHLLDNAVKFTHRGEVRFGYSIKPGALEFFVSDTGIGISQEIQPHIFEHFMQEESSITRDYEGSGLGLSIVNGLVTLLGGKLRLESEKGKGSVFFFAIPYEKDMSGIDVPNDRFVSAPLIDKPVILIAEDDESNYLLMVRLLRKADVTIIPAINGKEAVQKCHDHPELSLVIMDLKMPEMDGMEATREIKSFRKELPVIAVTAFAMSGDEKRALEAGCDDYIAKPVSQELLFSKLKKFGIVGE
jgi:PAS domain S-box-containing protein